MPEGDTIHRAARTLHTALAGQRVECFESVFAHLTRVDADTPIAGRVIERVEARGKHLLMWLSAYRPPEGRAIKHCSSEAEPLSSSVRGGASLVLRTHMRMHGSWHIYRPGERWRHNRRDMRVLIATADFEAVGFSIPVAEFIKVDPKHALTKHRVLGTLGPDALAAEFDRDEAVRRLRARPALLIADALLNQQLIPNVSRVWFQPRDRKYESSLRLPTCHPPKNGYPRTTESA